jgi:hypothetical protein
MNAVAEDTGNIISGFSFLGNDVYTYGNLGPDTDIVQSDNSAPRNAINVFAPPLALFDGSTYIESFARSNAHTFVHPKLDKQLLQRKHQPTGAPQPRHAGESLSEKQIR